MKYPYFIALKFIPSAKASQIRDMYPLLLVPLAYFVLNEPITKLKVIALLGACIGLIILSYNKNEDEHGNHEYYYLGIALT